MRIFAQLVPLPAKYDVPFQPVAPRFHGLRIDLKEAR